MLTSMFGCGCLLFRTCSCINCYSSDVSILIFFVFNKKCVICLSSGNILWPYSKFKENDASSLRCLTFYVYFTEGKGGKNRRRGKGDGEEAKRELEFKEEGQEYSQVVKMLGNGRCECFCFDGVTRLGHIRGKMRKKVWITAGDIVLVGKRDFQDEKVDIIHKYTADEARNLKQYGELPETARINEGAVDLATDGLAETEDIGIDFDDI